MKKARITRALISDGAGNETRTHKDLSIRPSNVRVYHFAIPAAKCIICTLQENGNTFIYKPKIGNTSNCAIAKNKSNDDTSMMVVRIG